MSVQIRFFGNITEDTTVAQARAVFQAGNGALYTRITDQEKSPSVSALDAIMALFLGLGVPSAKKMSLVKSVGFTSSSSTWMQNVLNGCFGGSIYYPSTKQPKCGWKEWREDELDRLFTEIDKKADTISFGEVFEMVQNSRFWNEDFTAADGSKWDMRKARERLLDWVRDENNVVYGRRGRKKGAASAVTTASEETDGEETDGEEDVDVGAMEDITAEHIVSACLTPAKDGTRVRQVVFTGAPGTGKTYAVRKFLEDKDYRFVQFHASYDYTDFIEGLRPIPPDGEEQGQTEGGNRFVRMDGVFKAYCREIVESNLKEKKDGGSASKKAPGWRGSEEHYFFIDEINRADLGRVFGELMFALEGDYRGEPFDTQYKNLPTYRRVGDRFEPIAEQDDVFRDGFFLPENLTIIGTMNDIDRSVETFDFALRRRFLWVDIKANSVMKGTLAKMAEGSPVKEEFEVAIGRIIDMNKKLSASSFRLSDAYHLGPAYFKYYFTDKERMWNEQVRPILMEYTRGQKDSEVRQFLERCRKALISEEEEADLES